MASYGLKIAKEGSTVEKEVAFSSDESLMLTKVGQQPAHFGLLRYTFPSKPTDPADGQTAVTPLVSVQHNLSYIPASMVFTYIDNPDPGGLLIPAQSYYRTPTVLTTAAGTSSTITYSCDSQKLQISYSVTVVAAVASKDVTGMSFIFKYYIFVNPGA